MGRGTQTQTARENVRLAVWLHKANLLSQAGLRQVAKESLAIELAESFEKKLKPKANRLSGTTHGHR